MEMPEGVETGGDIGRETPKWRDQRLQRKGLSHGKATIGIKLRVGIRDSHYTGALGSRLRDRDLCLNPVRSLIGILGDTDPGPEIGSESGHEVISIDRNSSLLALVRACRTDRCDDWVRSRRWGLIRDLAWRLRFCVPNHERLDHGNGVSQDRRVALEDRSPPAYLAFLAVKDL